MQTVHEPQGSQAAWRKCLLTLAITLIAMTIMPATAFAQSEADEEEYDGVMEEVIVTSARRREENVQDVPIAVSLLSKEKIGRAHV